MAPRTPLEKLIEIFGQTPVISPACFYNDELVIAFFEKNSVSDSKPKIGKLFELINDHHVVLAYGATFLPEKGRFLASYLTGDLERIIRPCWRFVNDERKVSGNVEVSAQDECIFVKRAVMAMDRSAASVSDPDKKRVFVIVSPGKSVTRAHQREEENGKVLWVSARFHMPGASRVLKVGA